MKAIISILCTLTLGLSLSLSNYAQELEASGSSSNRFGFTGYQYDTETNLYYAKARYYDPDSGRFIGQDSLEGALNNPPSLNKYLYVYQNPTKYVDKDGRSATVVGAVLGTSYGVGQAAGRAIYDYSQNNVQNSSHYLSLILQNAIGGIEIGGSIDAFALSGGVAASVSGGLGSAGAGAITFSGEPKTASAFVKDQAQEGAFGVVGGAALAKVAPVAAKIPGVSKAASYVGYKAGGFTESISSRYQAGALDNALGLRPPSPLGGATITVENPSGIGGLRVDANAERIAYENSVKDSIATSYRTTRSGEQAARITQLDGSVIDISSKRVKEYVPNTHPNAPPGTLDRVKFSDSLPGSKGYKRLPTQEELDILGNKE